MPTQQVSVVHPQRANPCCISWLDHFNARYMSLEQSNRYQDLRHIVTLSQESLHFRNLQTRPKEAEHRDHLTEDRSSGCGA